METKFSHNPTVVLEEWVRFARLVLRALFAITMAILSCTSRAAGAEDPFSIPLWTIERFLEAAPTLTANQVVKLRGVVTLHHRVGSLFIQDSTGAVFIQAQTNSNVRVGDIVEVVGGVSKDGFSPTLR